MVIARACDGDNSLTGKPPPSAHGKAGRIHDLEHRTPRSVATKNPKSGNTLRCETRCILTRFVAGAMIAYLLQLVARRSSALSFATRFAGAVLLTAVFAGPIQADENFAGSGSVAEWRAKLGPNELATAAYAAGVMAGSVFSECRSPRTVRELHTYLLYRAPSTLTMKQAIAYFLNEADCHVTSQEHLPPSSSIHSGQPGNIYAEEP
jgi:hypothetical protein